MTAQNNTDKQDFEVNFSEREQKVGYEQALSENWDEAHAENQSYDRANPVQASKVPEEKTLGTWKLLVAAFIALIVLFFVYSNMDTDTDKLSKINNRLTALENTTGNITTRIGTFTDTDKDSISKKLFTLADNQTILDGRITNLSKKVDTNIKSFRTVKKVSEANKRAIISLRKDTDTNTAKIEIRDTKIRSLDQLVAKLKAERCADIFDIDDSGLKCD